MIHMELGLLTEIEITEAQAENRMTVSNEGYSSVAFPNDKGVDRLAQRAYHDYGAITGHKNYQGLPMPDWKDLTPTIRDAWKNAVASVLFHCRYDSLQLVAKDDALVVKSSDKPFVPQGLLDS